MLSSPPLHCQHWFSWFLPPSQGPQSLEQGAARVEEGLAWVSLNSGCFGAMYRKFIFLCRDFLSCTACVLGRALEAGLWKTYYKVNLSANQGKPVFIRVSNWNESSSSRTEVIWLTWTLKQESLMLQTAFQHVIKREQQQEKGNTTQKKMWIR